MKKAFMIMAVLALVFATGCHKDPDNGGNNGGNAVTYTVTFNANGGSGTMQPQTFTEGEAKALTANAFTCAGLTFGGWNTTVDGSGTVYTDGQTITVSSDMTLYAQWGNTVNGHEWVDLGLPSGILWATCNVGASSPTDYGDHFAWGETEPQADNAYSWTSYKYANGDYDKLSKYCNNSNYGDNGYTDTYTVLLPEDDAATANWGAGWRMPTELELSELRINCTVTWTTQNGVNGCLFTSSNGNSLFMPAAGTRCDGSLDNVGSYGGYWSRSLIGNGPYFAWCLGFSSGDNRMGYNYRNYGFTVRPVCLAQN